MRRALALALVAMLLGVHSARGQVTIIDRINPGAYAGVTHANALRVEDVGGGGDSVNVFHQSTIRHVSSVTHVAGGIMIRDALCATCTARVDHTGAIATTATVTTDNVNVFHQSTIRHVSSVVHVGGFIGIRDGLCATCWARVDHAGALSTSASVTTDNVNVFHQSTVRHVSSMTHVVIVDWQRWAHIQASQSGSFTVQAAHQGGTPWTISHVSSVVHVGGFIGIRDGLNPTGWARVNHAGQLIMNCETGCGAGSSDAVNVFHQSTVRHVSSVSHVQIVGPSYGGTTQAEVKQGAPGSVAPWPVVSHAQQSGAWTVQAAHLAGVPSVSQGSVWAVSAHAQQSGSWTVQAAHQGGEWNIRHVTSVTHVALTGAGAGPAHLSVLATVVNDTSPRSTIAHVTSVLHVSAVVTTATVACPSIASFSQTASAQLITGVAGQRVAISGIVLVSDTAQSVSLVEGTGAVCATGIAAMLGGTAASISLAAQGGFTTVAGMPWLLSRTAADNVCLLQSGAGNVSGAITFRLIP